MIKAAIYARYSCNQQRETSIEDQIRRCREIAQRNGFTVDENHIFFDAARSGTEKHRELRDGYNALVKAWDAGEFNVLLADDLNRLTRDGVEQALIVRRLEQNQRVSLVTNNGIDTRILNWQVPKTIQNWKRKHLQNFKWHSLLNAEYLKTLGMSKLPDSKFTASCTVKHHRQIVF